MPRDGSQIYSVPPGTDGVPNFTIESAKYNTYVHDVEQDLNLPRPIVAGGTGANNAGQALVNLSGEQAAQIVTNWDSMLWAPGSFYAATTASGTAPVTGHKFAGICYLNEPLAYPPTNQNLVCEATDLTDPANPDKYIRVMTAGVWSNWTRVNPSTSSANLGEYTFSNQVTFPPGSGEIRFNNITQNSTTEVFISHLSPTGVDNTANLTFLLKSGIDLIVQDKDESPNYKIFTTTANAVLSGGDFRVTVLFKSGGIDIVTTQRVLVAASGDAQRAQNRQSIYAAPFDAMAYSGMQINGSMEVSQELGTTGTTVTSTHVCDGWRLGFNGTMAIWGITDSGGRPIFSTPWRIRITVTTALASFAASNFTQLFQRIEGWRVLRLGWGTANAQPITIGFWTAHNRVGIYSLVVRNGANDRSYAATYTQAVSDVAQFNTITILGDTTGTWTADNTTGLEIVFSFGCGTTNTAPSVNTWLAGLYIAAPGQINAVAATSDVFRITGVVVLPGIEAPSAARSPLVMRPYGEELVTCQRYFERLGADGGLLGAGHCISAPQTYIFVPYRKKRSTPTVLINNLTSFKVYNAAGGGVAVAANAGVYNIGTTGCIFNTAGSSGLVAGNGTELWDSDGTASIDVNARL